MNFRDNVKKRKTAINLTVIATHFQRLTSYIYLFIFLFFLIKKGSKRLAKAIDRSLEWISNLKSKCENGKNQF